jgi:sugar phosphate isomerase/epimerase
MTTKIGISTWAYQDLSLGDALERICPLSDNAEILCEARHSLLDPANLEAVDSFSLKYTVHGLITDINIASIHDAIRSASIELHRKAVEASAVAGASIYVVHPGFTSWPFYRDQALHSLDKSSRSYTRFRMSLAFRSVWRICPRATGSSIRVQV